MENQPHMTVTLPPQPGKALAHFVTAQKNWVSWPELYDVGVFDPECEVWQLEQTWASTSLDLQGPVDLNVDSPRRRSRYQIFGSHIVANAPANFRRYKAQV